jgi:hypothetical protein
VVLSGTNAGGDNLLEKELEEFEFQEHVEHYQVRVRRVY